MKPIYSTAPKLHAPKPAKSEASTSWWADCHPKDFVLTQRREQARMSGMGTAAYPQVGDALANSGKPGVE